MIKWAASKEEHDTIAKILDRYQEHHQSLGVPKQYQRSRMDLLMDLEATHCNGCRLDLSRLLEADDFNFMHDMIGIQKHLNRKTGELEDCFVPRYAV